jgi:hypothetical protein
MMLKKIACSSAFVLALATSSSVAHEVTFTAALSSIKVQARPGQVITRRFDLTLDKDQSPTHFKAHVEDWWRSEDGSQSFYAAPGTLKRSCGTWVTLNPEQSVVEPGQTLSVRITVNVSPDAEPGGYWCVLTLDEIPDPVAAADNIGVKFLASVSTGIFIFIDPVERAAEIVDVILQPTAASVKLRNLGNAPLGVEGRFEFIRPGEDKPIATAAIPRGSLLTEPVSTSLFTASLPAESALPSGRYLVRAIVDIGLDHYIGVQRELDVRR